MTCPLVVGLDLSVAATGIADQTGMLTTFKPIGTGDSRLTEIAGHVIDVVLQSEDPYGDFYLDQTGADLVVIEGPVVRSSAAVVIGMVQGAVRCRLMNYEQPYLVVSPATVKKYATGKGNATKADMRMALFQRFGFDVRDDNQVDAAWLRFLGLHLLGAPAVQLPKSHTDCLSKLTLPEGIAA